MEQEINLDEITDINLLQNLLDQTEDIDDRKAIRGRLAEIRAIERAKRDEKLARLTNTRETMLQEKQKKAAEHKARTLEMYNHMARSGEAGAKRQIDIGILKTGQVTPPSSPSAFNKDVDVLKQLAQDAEARKAKILANFQAASKAGSSTQANNDPAQEFIRARQEEARAEKERLLKAYDYVSKTGAGPKTVVLEELRRIDIA